MESSEPKSLIQNIVTGVAIYREGARCRRGVYAAAAGATIADTPLSSSGFINWQQELDLHVNNR